MNVKCNMSAPPRSSEAAQHLRLSAQGLSHFNTHFIVGDLINIKRPSGVAQVSPDLSGLYRGSLTRRLVEPSSLIVPTTFCRLEIGDTAS
jgi:hypothetical protein